MNTAAAIFVWALVVAPVPPTDAEPARNVAGISTVDPATDGMECF